MLQNIITGRVIRKQGRGRGRRRHFTLSSSRFRLEARSRIRAGGDGKSTARCHQETEADPPAAWTRKGNMAAKPDSAVNLDEERLAHALVSRGLLTTEEVARCKAGPDDKGGAEALLRRLIASGFLTVNQARRASQELSLLLGQQIPGYRLVERLGQGSMGSVYKARQLSMDRLVAVKILLPRLAAVPGFLERFTREAHLAAKLSHNNIVQAIDVGSAGKINYFVMEYVEGTTIQKELEAGKVYEEHEAVEIILQVAQALQHAHRRQLVHRDVKPANIILTPEGVAKLADLGLARATADQAQAQQEKGRVFGTPYYMAPEQAQGREDIDIRADIYSLGATFYHMVTGRQPFVAKSLDKMLRAHQEEELTPPDHLNTSLSAGLGEVVEFMMAKDRDQRYRTPDDLILDLECLLAGRPPKLARERIAATTLTGLAEGELEEEETGEAQAAGLPGGSVVWLLLLGGLLGLSVILNVVLILRRG
jgi:serine/threonine-protein kinase